MACGFQLNCEQISVSLFGHLSVINGKLYISRYNYYLANFERHIIII
jgi:hypothetical protein